MQEERFKIIVSSDVIAENIAYDVLPVFVGAFFDKFTAEDELTIQRQNCGNVSEKNKLDENW